MDCTLCMDCVKACPHDNIGLFAVAPVRDLLRDPVRSSMGRFSSRIDIAALVLVVVHRGLRQCRVDGGSAAASTWRWLVVLAAAVTALLVAAQPVKKGILLPLLACPVAFGIGHVGCSSALSSLHRLGNSGTGSPSGRHRLRLAYSLAGSMGNASCPCCPPMHALGTASAAGCRSVVDAVPGLETGAAVGRARRPAVLLLLPWATMVAAGYAAGVWILLQPMQMRGVIMNP